jgi:hypothetical protein
MNSAQISTKQTSINSNKGQQITQSCVAVKNNGCQLFIKTFLHHLQHSSGIHHETIIICEETTLKHNLLDAIKALKDKEHGYIASLVLLAS